MQQVQRPHQGSIQTKACGSESQEGRAQKQELAATEDHKARHAGGLSEPERQENRVFSRPSRRNSALPAPSF